MCSSHTSVQGGPIRYHHYRCSRGDGVTSNTIRTIGCIDNIGPIGASGAISTIGTIGATGTFVPSRQMWKAVYASVGEISDSGRMLRFCEENWEKPRVVTVPHNDWRKMLATPWVVLVFYSIQPNCFLIIATGIETQLF